MTTIAPGIRFADVRFQGTPSVIATVVLQGPSGVALIDPGPASTLPQLERELEEGGIGVEDVGAILLTHIHLDHAGATGVLVRRNPRIHVYVHERGAPHLVDPTKLLNSAARLYGDRMDALWGPFLAVPTENVTAVAGGETIEAAGHTLQTAYTPGHASHHVAYFDPDSRIAFVGDAGGVSLPPAHVVLPPTPPPDIDLDAWRATTDRILAWHPDALFLTHFGLKANPPTHLQELLERLQMWARRAETLVDQDLPDEVKRARFVRDVTLDLRRELSDADLARYLQAAPIEQCWLGLERYWRKRRERA
ncbi:MAG TPA: MBL fold metallo-hydrolase [Vicinamibacterales bacterium]